MSIIDHILTTSIGKIVNLLKLLLFLLHTRSSIHTSSPKKN